MTDRGRIEGQNRLEDDVFELRSPQKRNSIIPAEIVFNGQTQEYVVKVGNTIGASHKVLAEALHEAANRIDASRMFGSGEFLVDHIEGQRLRSCDYCGGKLFFAKTINEKWMPVDSLSVNAKEAKGMRLFSIMDVGGTPHVRPLVKGQGEVWIAHPDVCGGNSIRPLGDELSARWVKNREVTEAMESVAKTDLVAMLDELGE